jgi:hypothetical protein
MKKSQIPNLYLHVIYSVIIILLSVVLLYISVSDFSYLNTIILGLLIFNSIGIFKTINEKK